LRLASHIERLRFWLEALNPPRAIQAKHDFHNVFGKARLDLQRLSPVPLREARILILGCGYHYPEVLLFTKIAPQTHGVDVRNEFYRDGFRPLYRHYRNQGKGVLAAVYCAQTQRIGMRRYYSTLCELAGTIPSHRSLRLRSYDGRRLPHEDESFDVLVSNAVLEHVLNLAGFFAEVARVARRGAVSYNVVHNYCSFSGSLRSEWYNERYPWGHLRGVYQPNPKHLNTLRIGQIVELFSRSFEMTDMIPLGRNHSKKGVDPSFSYEREDLLTDEIRAELAVYSREELLTRSYLLIGTRR
jgi:SAM-dependent methyltransferase